MKTHNAVIYHCLCCGNVVHCAREVEPPQCCGREMVPSAEETVGESQDERPKVPAKRVGTEIPPVIRAK